MYLARVASNRLLHTFSRKSSTQIVRDIYWSRLEPLAFSRSRRHYPVTEFAHCATVTGAAPRRIMRSEFITSHDGREMTHTFGIRPSSSSFENKIIVQENTGSSWHAAVEANKTVSSALHHIARIIIKQYI